MRSNDSDKLLLQKTRRRALALLDALSRDGDDLRNAGNDALAEGAALCEQATHETQRLVAELDAELRAGEDSQS